MIKHPYFSSFSSERSVRFLGVSSQHELLTITVKDYFFSTLTVFSHEKA